MIPEQCSPIAHDPPFSAYRFWCKEITDTGLQMSANQLNVLRTSSENSASLSWEDIYF